VIRGSFSGTAGAEKRSTSVQVVLHGDAKSGKRNKLFVAGAACPAGSHKGSKTKKALGRALASSFISENDPLRKPYPRIT